jgi:hypothetical protein
MSGNTNSNYRRVQVVKVLSSRYAQSRFGVQRSARPSSWDDRQDGIDTVEVEGGEVIKLASTAMQSTPKANWVLMLTGGTAHAGFAWTLYGMPRAH